MADALRSLLVSLVIAEIWASLRSGVADRDWAGWLFCNSCDRGSFHRLLLPCHYRGPGNGLLPGAEFAGQRPGCLRSAQSETREGSRDSVLSPPPGAKICKTATIREGRESKGGGQWWGWGGGEGAYESSSSPPQACTAHSPHSSSARAREGRVLASRETQGGFPAPGAGPLYTCAPVSPT